MVDIVVYLFKHPLLLLVLAVGGGVLYRFVYGKYTTRNNTTTSGEGETYLTPDEHIELAINAAEKKGKKILGPEKKEMALI